LSKDITPILNGWDHDPDEFQVRIVVGIDGRDKLQRRLDLGLIQMELSGRPDGERPFGHDSLLDYHEARALEAKDPDDYALDSDECEALMREGVQYYQRYLAAYHLRRFDLVARDTTRNLRLFAFAVKHAVDRRDKVQFDQYRPYVLMMRARALGAEAMDRNDHAAALRFLDEGIEGIRAFLRQYEQDEDQFQCRELTKLLRIRRDVEQSRPVGPAERLEQQLELAVTLENYEEAARIRDQIARLKGAPSNADPKAARDAR
jgi:UvrB/uvrC motif